MKKIIGYILALVIGLLPGFFIVFNSVFTDSSGSLWERVLTFILVIFSYGILGLIFGFIGRETSWKWGLWLSAPAVVILVLYSFKEPGTILLNLLYIVLTLASACLASSLGARTKHA